MYVGFEQNFKEIFSIIGQKDLVISFPNNIPSLSHNSVPQRATERLRLRARKCKQLEQANRQTHQFGNERIEEVGHLWVQWNRTKQGKDIEQWDRD